MDVGYTGTASASIIWVVCDGKESNTLLQSTILANLGVKVWDDGDVEGRRARLYPVLAELVAVAVVYGLDAVAKVVDETNELLEAPAITALGLPLLEIVFEWAERDKGVMRRAASKDLGTGVADVGVSCRDY